MVKRFVMTMMILLSAFAPLKAADRPYLNAALQAARWIRSAAVQTNSGVAWPSDPRDEKTVSTDLYYGNAGSVLFFIEAYRSTGDETYLKDARAGADYLLANLQSEKENGLYVGIAGLGFTLEETYKATREAKYRQGVILCLRLLRERAQKAGHSIAWGNDTDIISGSAGTGLFLLYAARELKDPSARELAALAGRRLIELGRPEGGGLKWSWSADPKKLTLMPNFSHGTAGIAYFLATLYRETKKKEFLDAAIAGARYLQSVAKTDGDVCLIFHNEVNGRDLHYLGWCHGPAGTARLFYRLYQVTGDRAWMEWVRKSARADMESGIPDKRTPGFWNNVSQCCGSAGVAEFFLNLYGVTGERRYLEFSKRMTADLLARATREGNGMKWVQSEHRVKPDLLVAQTGYMQGAAGLGMLLLHLDDAERGKKWSIILPDSPFGGRV
jgi:lantibiotic modifying enzyme